MNSFIYDQIEHCHLCPRECGINRKQSVGFCGASSAMTAARAALHFWEEPCISGENGSGTVFFSGCSLRCCFCQNYQISQELFGKEISSQKLADIFLNLQENGANNINLVTATHYLPWILPALDQIKDQLHIPVVYNSSGYERVETVKALRDYVDIWLPDLKYYSNELSAKYSHAADYFSCASAAIKQMIAQTGEPKFEIPESGSTPLMKKGVIIRHLVLPGQKDDSIRLMRWIADELPKGHFFLSLMSQYTPPSRHQEHKELRRKLTTYEYQKVIDTALELGLDQGFVQEKSSADEKFRPPFNLEGIL